MNKTDINSFLNKNGYTKIALSQNGIGHFKVNAKVNGAKASFIIDTGASHTVIDEFSSEKFKLNFSNGPSKEAGGLGTSGIKTRVSKKNNIIVKGFEINNLALTVLSLEHVNSALEKHGSPKIDGVIGADILKKYNAVIDYKGKAIYLK